MNRGRATGLQMGQSSAAPVSHRIIEDIAERTGNAVDELPQLYDVIDPEALDGLFDRPGTFLDGHLTFEYSGYHVTVNASGEIDIDPID